MTVIAWWVLAGIILYVYAGYPLLLRIACLLSRAQGDQSAAEPTVTLITAAYNEEAVIRQKLENILALDYPREKLQAIVASDASSDGTDDIVAEYAGQSITLNRQAERRGKSTALNDTVGRLATGDIIVFSDASTIFEPDALRKAVRNFADPRVGVVCTHLIFANTTADGTPISRSEGLYWRYEEALRRLESEAGALAFVSGAFYAIRRSLYTPVPPHLPDDSVSPLGAIKKGYRVVFEEEAVAYETAAESAEGEFRIKARGVVRELGSILAFRSLLNPLRHPMVALALLSHRLLRWSVGLMLAVVLALNVQLAGSPFFLATLLLQLLFYALAVGGHLLRKRANQPRLVSLPYYYCLVNLAALSGIWQLLSGRRRATWQPVR
ncbi:MAG: glycosyltransferase family 2 protein [Chloroflexi bacterium]|nr:glycosyltransferase family 2 protein [Chloroflexota bacterium]